MSYINSYQNLSNEEACDSVLAETTKYFEKRGSVLKQMITILQNPAENLFTTDMSVRSKTYYLETTDTVSENKFLCSKLDK